MKKELLQSIKVIVLALIVTGGVHFAMATWTAAPANPPSNNVEAPINAGRSLNSGGYQRKLGALWVNDDSSPQAVGFYVRNGESWFNGKIKTPSIQITGGTPAVGQVLTVSDTAGNATWEDLGSVSAEKFPNFGGMYSNAAGAYSGYNNPLTNAKSCPTGYRAYAMFGKTNVDNTLYLCLGDADLTTPVAQWGGMYSPAVAAFGYVGYSNPYTAEESCPAGGYTPYKVFGQDSVDYSIYFCYKPDTTTASNFPGFFARDGVYGNPVTQGGFGCPSVMYHFTKMFGKASNPTDNIIMMCTPATIPILQAPIVNE